jgi:hypothetical protein
MWKISVAFLLALTSLVANAQVYKAEKPVVCSSLKTVIEYVSSEFQEQPFWRGAGDNSKYILTTNPTTHSWTMIEYNDSVACVVGVGDEAHLIKLGKNI